MGGKSRKTGGVSRALINRIKKGKTGGKKPERKKSGGLLDSPGKQQADS